MSFINYVIFKTNDCNGNIVDMVYCKSTDINDAFSILEYFIRLHSMDEHLQCHPNIGCQAKYSIKEMFKKWKKYYIFYIFHIVL